MFIIGVVCGMLVVGAVAVVLQFMGATTAAQLRRTLQMAQAGRSELLAACIKAMSILTQENEEAWIRSQKHEEAPYHFLWVVIRKAEINSKNWVGTMKEALASVHPRWHDDLIKFARMGTGSSEFLALLESDEGLQQALERIIFADDFDIREPYQARQKSREV